LYGSKVVYKILLSVSISLLLVSLYPFDVFSGGPGVLSILHGEDDGDQFGISIANAGDVNGDGYQDLIVGASLSDEGGYSGGKCYLYLGGQVIDTLPRLTIVGKEGERLGSRVGGGGDLNGDGFDDFVIYAAGDTNSAGVVFVYLGGFQPDGVPDLIINGSGHGDRFGYAISLAGDLNGDGFSDLVIGAPEANSNGKIYIYFGSEEPDTIADLVIAGLSNDEFFGCAISTSGDVNGDGYDDLLVGARRNSDVSFWAGKAYLYLGGSQMDTTCDLEISGEFMGDGFGASVCISPDINGDNYDDFVIGAPYFNTTVGSDVGKVYIYLGGSSLDDVVDAEIIGELAQDMFGYSVASEDIDGDGLADVIIGAPNYGGTEVQMGKVYLFYGGIPFDTTCDFADVGLDTLDGLGFSVAAFSQLTYHSDGSGEFAAGAWNMDGKGAVEIYGSELVPTSADAIDVPGIASVVEIFPNPSYGRVMMRMKLERALNVEVILYDVSGRRVVRKDIGRMGPGEELIYPVTGSTFTSLKAGVYFLRVKIGQHEVVKKLLIMR